MQSTILIVDDKLSVQQLLVDFLSGQGFKVLQASNGLEAVQKIKQAPPDLVLLDMLMPLMNGRDCLQLIRSMGDLPVIIISAKQQEEDIIDGFELGADDYITKPFRVSELLARIKAVLKRTNTPYPSMPNITVGCLTMNESQRELRTADRVIDLTNAEFVLLTMLMKSEGHTVSKAQISIQLIDQGFSGSESTLKIHIRNLRKKISPYINNEIEIESVFGIGYRIRVTCDA